MNSNRNPSPEKIRAVIESWLGMRLDPAAAAWVRDRQRVIKPDCTSPLVSHHEKSAKPNWD